MSRPIVAITGASGFLGGHVAEGFRDRGWEVRALVRPGSRKVLPEGVARVEAALDAAGLQPAFAGATAVVHLAGLARAARESDLERVNVEGTRAAVAAANQAGARLVFVSSQAAAGPGTADRPCRESDMPRPLTPYGRSKLGAEGVVRDLAAGEWVVIRLVSVYGPRDRQFLPLFRMASRGLFPLATRPGAAFSLVHVEDVVRSLVLAAAVDRAAGETLFVGHREPTSEMDMARALARILGRRCRTVSIPQPVLAVVAAAGQVSWRLGLEPLVDAARLAELRSPGFVCAMDRAHEVLGFRADIDLDEGLERTAAWYRAAGWI